MYKKISILVLPIAALAILLVPSLASAHVTVTPGEVGIGEFPTFSANVPVEKDVPTTGLRLVIPGGMNYVQPNVKAGWKISQKKTGEGESARVTEISWTGGSIPSGQRDQFLFAAQTPESATELNWKAYQTYADGTVVAWDDAPTEEEVEGSKPYSVTKVVDDLTGTASDAPESTKSDQASTNNGTIGLVAGIIAVIISVGSILLRKK